MMSLHLVQLRVAHMLTESPKIRFTFEKLNAVGMFPQNGFQTIRESAVVEIVFDNVPGHIYHGKMAQSEPSQTMGYEFMGVI